MSNYIDQSDALDILDQFEDAVENGEGGFFYSKAIEMMSNLPSEELIYCKDCEYFSGVVYVGKQFEWGECCAGDELKDRRPNDFCSWARLKK